MSNRHCDRLLQLLDRERAFLMRGDFAGAAKLTGAKEKLSDQVLSGGSDVDRIGAVKMAAERNTQLIEAAKKGVEAAQNRLHAIRKGVGVNTYSAQGQRQMIARTDGTLHKRA